MGLLVATVALAAAVGWGLFRLYALLLALVLKRMKWDLKDLKDYPITPAVRFWDRVVEVAIFAAILCKILYFT